VTTHMAAASFCPLALPAVTVAPASCLARTGRRQCPVEFADSPPVPPLSPLAEIGARTFFAHDHCSSPVSVPNVRIRP
jgi:hypothetical protein